MEIVADKKHARLGPSGWDRWSNCPGSPALSDGLPNTTSRYAAEGTIAHEVADRVLRGDVGSAGDMLGQTLSHGGFDFEVDEEMVEAVDLYVSTVHELIGDGILMPEQQVPIGHLTGEEGAEGTSDTIGISEDGKRLIVVDLKYGKGVYVSATGNGQGRMYALGALQKFGMVYDEIEEVQVVIVQPRMDNGITDEVLSIGELEEFRDQVELAAGEVTLADEQFKREGMSGEFEAYRLVPGEKQCKFCLVNDCPARLAEVSKGLALVSSATIEDFADLTLPKQASSLVVNPGVSSDKLAEFMRAVPLIESAIAGVRAEVERRLFAGEEVTGYYLGVGRKGNRKWVEGAEEQLKKRLGAGKTYVKKLIGVPEAEKLFKNKPQAWAKIKDLITQSEGKPSVCADGDKNEPYTPVTAADFADLSAQSEAERLLS